MAYRRWVNQSKFLDQDVQKPVKIWWHKLPILNRCMISEVSTVGVFGSSSSMKRLVTLNLTCQPSKKDMDYLPSMHFQMRAVSLMEGYDSGCQYHGNSK